MKGSRLLTFIGARLRITIAGERTMEGTLMAFDRHMSAFRGAARVASKWDSAHTGCARMRRAASPL